MPCSRIVPTTTAMLCIAALQCGGCASSGRGGDAARAARPGEVAGQYLLTLGDADLSVDRHNAARDTLTVVTLPIREPITPSAQVAVSNSAAGSPACFAASPDGRFAYVVESRGGGAGEGVAAIDLTAPASAKLIGTTFVGRAPQALAVHPQGDLLAVATHNPRGQLVILPASAEGTLGEPASWPLLGLDDEEATPSSVAWHPSGKALAVTLAARGEVVFYAFDRAADGGMAVAAWGAPVKLGAGPIAGSFGPDGRLFIAATKGGGGGGDGPGGVGGISVVRVSDDVNAPSNAATSHRLLSIASVGVAPVGAAVSPDGSLVAVANTRTAIDAGSGGSISLFSMSKDGSLAARGEYLLGAVPAGISFDTRGTFVLVSQFRSLDPEASDGEVSFWKVRRGSDGTTLEQQEFFVGVGSGPHGVLIVR